LVDIKSKREERAPAPMETATEDKPKSFTGMVASKIKEQRTKYD